VWSVGFFLEIAKCSIHLDSANVALAIRQGVRRQLAEMMIIIIAKVKHVPLATLNISPYVSMMTANGKVSTLIRECDKRSVTLKLFHIGDDRMEPTRSRRLWSHELCNLHVSFDVRGADDDLELALFGRTPAVVPDDPGIRRLRRF